METVIRVFIIYLFILAALRVIGKREFGQMSPLELTSLLLIPELVSQSVVREDFSLVNGLIAVATLLTLVFFSSLLQHHSKKVAQIISGEPSVLVEHGRLIQEHLDRERVQTEEIFSAMHTSGLERLEQVKWAILETDGRISIVPTEAAPAGGGRNRDDRLAA